MPLPYTSLPYVHQFGIHNASQHDTQVREASAQALEAGVEHLVQLVADRRVVFVTRSV